MEILTHYPSTTTGYQAGVLMSTLKAIMFKVPMSSEMAKSHEGERKVSTNWLAVLKSSQGEAQPLLPSGHNLTKTYPCHL